MRWRGVGRGWTRELPSCCGEQRRREGKLTPGLSCLVWEVRSVEMMEKIPRLPVPPSVKREVEESLGGLERDVKVSSQDARLSD